MTQELLRPGILPYRKLTPSRVEIQLSGGETVKIDGGAEVQSSRVEGRKAFSSSRDEPIIQAELQQGLEDTDQRMKGRGAIL